MTASISAERTATLTPFYAEEATWAQREAPTIPIVCTKDLGPFIPAISPKFGPPEHIPEVLDIFRRIDRGERVLVTFSMPPRHMKSETCMHGIARYIGRNQDKRNVYATYASDFARGQSRKIRRYTEECGVKVDPSANRLEEWLTPFGGGLFATGVGGPLTGKGVDGIGLVDDPVKNREEAESPRTREKIWEWFTDVFMTRLEGNASAIVVMTRWHPDDLIGRLQGMDGWEHINIPIVSGEGAERRALLPFYPGPERKKAYPLEWCDWQREQVGEYTWASLYMGEPRPKGGALFGPAYRTRLANVPREGVVAIGLDLAYTAKTHSDYCTAVVLRRRPETVTEDVEGKLVTRTVQRVYVEHVVRKQERAEQFIDRIRSLSGEYPGAPIMFHGSHAEVGSADVIRKLGLRQLRAEPATGDKFTRAQEVAAAWNRGEVWVPDDQPWSRAFLSEIAEFTGVGDRYDDQVDAFASAFAALGKAGGQPLQTRGRRRTSGLGRSY